ncbi:MAG: hypothetical protein V4671_21455 [Armatimonadota bacterium]
MWRKREITRAAVGLVAAGLLAVTVTCRALSKLPTGPPLLPVDAPLAPAPPGTRFAPDAPAITTKVQNDGDLPPRSTGTHITASLLRKDGSRLAAVWGDPILWERRGKSWRPAPNVPRLTGAAAEVVALSEEAATRQLTIRTRRAGNFTTRNGGWKPLPRPNAPQDANAQALAAYRGTLFVATLNDGLVARNEKGIWTHIAPPVISANAPRQFVVWHDDLYVRHGNGVVDRFDGRQWTRDIFTRLLPRRQVSALATDGDTLFLAQWGGWSETRGGTVFRSRFSPDLKDLPITALLPVNGTLYVGTQGRGLAECDLATGNVRQWHDERQGIGDDWITTLARSPGGRIVAGTFVQGAYSRTENSGSPWTPVQGAAAGCVTGTAATPDGVRIALRQGGVIGLPDDTRAESSIAKVSEAQCLLPDLPNNLIWIGTRTGIEAVRLRE